MQLVQHIDKEVVPAWIADYLRVDISCSFFLVLVGRCCWASCLNAGAAGPNRLGLFCLFASTSLQRSILISFYIADIAVCL